MSEKLARSATMAEIENYINHIPRFADKTGADNLRTLLDALKNPEQRFRSVHIAGTNGKGSTAKMMSLMLRGEGLKTGLFVSPHLITINERMEINGELISDEDFIKVFWTVMDAVDSSEAVHPSFFEFLFVMSAVYFAWKEVDFVVYETGLGGRLDATNVITPAVSIITSIGMDHMQYLGDTIEKIAFEKAGIIKPGVPVVYNTGDERADEVIRARAKELGSEALNAGETEIQIASSDGGKIDFSLVSRYYRLDRLLLHSRAYYQLKNAATAALSFRILGGNMANVAPALEQFSWMGRMQFVRDNIILDGAHNEDAAEELCKSLRAAHLLGANATAGADASRGEEGFQKRKLLFAVSSDKDYNEVIRIMTSEFQPETVYVSEFVSERHLDQSEAVKAFVNHGLSLEQIQTFTNSRDAFIAATKELGEDELLLCMGSLYLVGELISELEDI